MTKGSFGVLCRESKENLLRTSSTILALYSWKPSEVFIHDVRFHNFPELNIYSNYTKRWEIVHMLWVKERNQWYCGLCSCWYTLVACIFREIRQKDTITCFGAILQERNFRVCQRLVAEFYESDARHERVRVLICKIRGTTTWAKRTLQQERVIVAK